ncbi:MAG: hypothetical protein U9N45_05780, partial [Gemmatimonadota bacterium]|nr:hypothetical protein [Gemmatimonadota bacterium]
DIIGTVFIKNASSKLLHKIGIVVTLLMGLLTIVIAYYYNTLPGLGVFDLLIKVGSVLGIPVAVPVILGLVYRRTPDWVPYVVILVGMAVGAVFAIGNWEQYLGYELFYAVLYPLLCAIYIIPGMLFRDEDGGSSGLRTWAKVLLYGLGVYFFFYGVFLYSNLPGTAGGGGEMITDPPGLVWIQRVILALYSSKAAMVAYAVVWAALTEIICRLRIVPGIRYSHQVKDFFIKKMNTPVDVAKEMGPDYDERDADLSSLKILGIVMVIIASLMGLFFFIEMTRKEVLITLAGLLGNMAIGLWMLYLGTRKKDTVKKAGSI